MAKLFCITLALVWLFTESAASSCNICSPNSGSRIVFHNNLGRTVDVITNGGRYGSCSWGGSKVPPCLRGLRPGASAAVTLESHFGWRPQDNWGYNFGTANPGSLFEITSDHASRRDYYDISYNAGYNIPMTVVAPDGGTHVATSINSPDVYPAGADTCTQVQPCASATWSAPQGTYHVYLGNRRGDIDSPGPCGCRLCPGFNCAGHQSNQFCTTSGSGLWCWQNAPGAPHCPICGGNCPRNCP